MDENSIKILRLILPIFVVFISGLTFLKYAPNPNFNHLITLIIIVVVGFSIAWAFFSENLKLFFTCALRVLSIAFFLSVFSMFVISLLFPEVFLGEELNEKKEIQIFACVASAGTMGGLMRYLMEEKVQNGELMDLWSLSHSAISGLFVSVILFLVLRAGIINKVQIDTFNVYGVSGVSAVVGFLADRMVKRISGLYEEVVGKAGESKR